MEVYLLGRISSVERKLMSEIAEQHKIPSNLLEDLIKTANNFEYENVSAGKRQTEYLNSIIFAINNSK